MGVRTQIEMEQPEEVATEAEPPTIAPDDQTKPAEEVEETRENEEAPKTIIPVENEEKRASKAKKKEETKEGLHLIDFEQLKIENQTYKEKIEECKEDVDKLDNKIESAVQVLTHMKEKLDFLTTQNSSLEQKLQTVEIELTASRDKLGKMKLARDSLRRENTELQQNMGLLGKEDLLYDFEEQIQNCQGMSDEIVKLQARHVELKKENQIYKRKLALKQKEQLDAPIMP